MADQNELLKLLAATREPLTIDAICKATSRRKMPVGSPARKSVIKCLGRLVGRGLVEVTQIEPETFPPSPNRGRGYKATKDGRDFAKAGRDVSEHVVDYPAVTKPKQGPKANAEAFRADLWKAFRLKKKASLRELIEAVDHHGVVKVETVAGAWMKALISSGVAVALKTREQGFAPTSNGFKRYALLRDLGVQPPKPTSCGFLFDPNACAQIPYVTGKYAPRAKTEAA